MHAMLYLLYANALILAQNTYYEFRRVNQYWDWIKFQAAEGNVKIPKQILFEIAEKKDFVANWTKKPLGSSSRRTKSIPIYSIE